VSDSSPPLVSVVVPAWNAERFLAATLESALAQQGPSCEVIVVDDGSTDGTPAVIAGFGDRIRSRRIENSGGPSRPRNVGIAMARGELIALLDSDDLMLPGALRTATAAYAAHPDAGLLCGDYRVIDGQGRVTVERGLAGYRRFRGALRPLAGVDLGLLPAREAFHQMLWANFVGTSGVVLRREVLRDVGPFDEALPNGDDRDMWLRIVRRGWDLLFVDRPVFAYRKYGEGVTARGGERLPAMIRVLERQRDADLTAVEERRLRRRLGELWTAYGWHLRQQGDPDGARGAYRRAMAHGITAAAWRGWLLARLGR